MTIWSVDLFVRATRHLVQHVQDEVLGEVLHLAAPGTAELAPGVLDFLVEVEVVLVEQFPGARLGLAPGAPQLVPLAQCPVERGGFIAFSLKILDFGMTKEWLA